MAEEAKKFESPSSHVEEVSSKKMEIGTEGLSHQTPKTTLYQVVFSLFVGISGWMYNFDLVSSHFGIIHTCLANKAEGLQRCCSPHGAVQSSLWQLRADAGWQGRHCQ